MRSEATFTAPHPACPHPEWWHAPDGDSTEVEVTELVAALVRAIQPEYVVETGAAFGHTTRAIGEALARNGHGRLVSLEVDPERAARSRERVAEVPQVSDLVEVREQSSLEFEPQAPIDFAFFDSLYELRAQEFRRFRDLGALTAGVIVAFHDWTSGLRGHYLDVRQEVEGLARARLLRPVYVPTPRGLVIAEVL